MRLPPLFLPALVSFALLPGGIAGAHESPEHVAEALTARIEREGRTAPLLYRRAVEYRVLGKLDAAAGDLQAALAADPAYVPAHRELSRIRLIQGRSGEALAGIDRAIALTPGERERAPLYTERARVHLAAGNPAAALADCERGLAHRPDDVDGYLTRSRLQARLGKWDACIAGLKTGFETTGSAALAVEWTETLIDAGRFSEALARIEPELGDARWQGSWLLRRARALRGVGEATRARADLRAAIAEMDRRIRPEMPDLMLLAERGLAHALLGDRAAATRDLETARSKGATPWTLRRLESSLGKTDAAR